MTVQFSPSVLPTRPLSYSPAGKASFSSSASNLQDSLHFGSNTLKRRVYKVKLADGSDLLVPIESLAKETDGKNATKIDDQALVDRVLEALTKVPPILLRPLVEHGFKIHLAQDNESSLLNEFNKQVFIWPSQMGTELRERQITENLTGACAWALLRDKQLVASLPSTPWGQQLAQAFKQDGTDGMMDLGIFAGSLWYVSLFLASTLGLLALPAMAGVGTVLKMESVALALRDQKRFLERYPAVQKAYVEDCGQRNIKHLRSLLPEIIVLLIQEQEGILGKKSMLTALRKTYPNTVQCIQDIILPALQGQTSEKAAATT